MEILKKMLLKCETTEDKIFVLQEYAKSLSQKKLKKVFESSFMTLNNPNRWKYIWQKDTLTHQKYLLFLVIFKMYIRQEERNSGDSDDFIAVMDRVVDVYSDKASPFTAYLIIKTFKKKKNELLSLNLKLDNIKPKFLINLMPDKTYYKTYNTYEDKLKEAMEKIKK